MDRLVFRSSAKISLSILILGQGESRQVILLSDFTLHRRCLLSLDFSFSCDFPTKQAYLVFSWEYLFCSPALQDGSLNFLPLGLLLRPATTVEGS